MTLAFRSPNAEAYKAAAARQGLRQSDWLRAAADDALKAQGFCVASPETQYALVADGNLVGDHVTFRPHALAGQFAPGTVPENAVWLPIENRDAGPFDPAQHWRLKPLPLRVEGDVVVREYPIVAKCQELA